MDEAATLAFLDELEKVGFDIQGLAAGAAKFIGRGGAPLVLGALGGSLVLYDALKARGIKGEIFAEDILGKTRGSKKVDSKEYINDLQKENPPDRSIIPVTTIKDVKKITSDPAWNKPVIRDIMNSRAKHVILTGRNAFMVPGAKRDYVVVAPEANPRVIEHEVGHARDLGANPVTLMERLRRILGVFWKPSFEKGKMKREETAWEHAKKTPLRDRALATYERSFHTGRATVIAPLVGSALIGGISEGLNI